MNRSAGFQTCRIADFQIGKSYDLVQSADFETRDTADLEVCATVQTREARVNHLTRFVNDL